MGKAIAKNAPMAVQASKRMMRMGMNETFNDHVHHVFLQLLPLFQSDDFKEGKQSLRFDVKKCSSIGGRYSPGFTNEFFDTGRFEGAGIYKISFWIKNHGTTFNVSGGSVSAKEGDMKTLIEENEEINDWKLHEYEINVPKDSWLRMQLNILQPGTFWIDDIKIEKL